MTWHTYTSFDLLYWHKGIRKIQSADIKEMAKIAKSKKPIASFGKQLDLIFSSCVRRKMYFFMHDSYLCSCFRLILYIISQLLMKLLMAGSSVMHVYALDALHWCGVQIITHSRRCDYKGR